MLTTHFNENKNHWLAAAFGAGLGAFYAYRSNQQKGTTMAAYALVGAIVFCLLYGALFKQEEV